MMKGDIEEVNFLTIFVVGRPFFMQDSLYTGIWTVFMTCIVDGIFLFLRVVLCCETHTIYASPSKIWSSREPSSGFQFCFCEVPILYATKPYSDLDWGCLFEASLNSPPNSSAFVSAQPIQTATQSCLLLFQD
jgi:hypothetical protein